MAAPGFGEAARQDLVVAVQKKHADVGLRRSHALLETNQELIRIEGAPAGVSSATVALANRFGTLQALALAD